MGDGGKISGKARLRDDADPRPLQIICWLAIHYKMFCKIKLVSLEGDRRDRALFVRSGAAGEG